MRSVVCRELGAPEVLRVEDGPALDPRPGQVVVGVRAAGVNYVDGLFVAGQYQIKPPLPFTPGSEVAGEIIRVGEGVSGIAAGDRVLVMCGLGGFAEEVAVPATSVVRLPSSLEFARAAGFVQSYCTAMFALRERARLEPGEIVLVLGAGGGVGLATVDVAKALGASVIAAASSEEKRAAAVDMGADALVDYGTEDLKTRARQLAEQLSRSAGRPEPTGVDVVLDPVGGDHAEGALRALGYLGRYIVIGFAAGDIPRLPLNQVLLRNRSIVGVDWGAWSIAEPDANRTLLAELLDLVGAGRLHPPEPSAYPLEGAGEALDDLLGRRLTGKAVLVP